MPRRLHPSLADYVTIAVTPALIMVLVGSLVFFLLEVFYLGQYPGRLRYIMALFIFAAVLIGRISMEEGVGRAAMFSFPLAAVTLLAIFRFVEYRGGPLADWRWLINTALVGLIWWCAHKLTWDCTLLDETEEVSGEGLLQTVGLDNPHRGSKVIKADDVARNSFRYSKIEATTSGDEPALSRWQRLVDRRKRPHPHGVWVVYFSLAALPLFGIGQWFIPAGRLDSRQHVFWLLCLYMASGLGLLMTTSFLGLRRYLRQRRLQMPATMSGTWVAVGCGLIFAVLLLATLVPRPAAEYSISKLPSFFQSPDQESSRYGLGRDGPEEAGADKESRESPRDHDGGESSDAQSVDSNRPSDDERHQGEDETGSGDEPDDETGTEGDSEEKSRDDEQRQSSREESNNTKGGSADQRSQAEEGKQSGRASSQTKTPRSGSSPSFANASNILKWILYFVVAAIIAYAAWRYRRELLAAVRSLLLELREFWDRLFGQQRDRTSTDGVTSQQSLPPPPRPFADYADPFATGIADRFRPDELVRYSFEAFEAWAREHGCGRQPGQTPHEWTGQVAQRDATLLDDMRTLANLYGQVAYGPGSLTAANVQPLQHLWQRLQGS